ncbi:L-aminoadipate-semialdehyde dehydrogenase-phosphopantetheinyl transferase-like [Daphnia carinata]|uniref:L-aminoadipate-semialdehyde dehydrogenase-phosphopantetheinyl transferase-like n=1 Tax=Daphnia carinata TaxID=120202 RepID=UPI002868A26F|nr:L-aminoadipate-semialdehyde dehydrogenase-phosphopantetheinyl transferase-like [Daphnia carinata]
MLKMSKSEVRWAVNIAKWRPCGVEWSKALSVIQEKERERICRFTFKRDAKASLVGQLMLHKLIRETLQIPNEEVQFERTEKGKPFLPKLALPYQFNVSHQGAYTVVAASSSTELLGVDIMRIDDERFEEETKLQDFFYTMRRQFTYREWKNIRHGNRKEQLKNFYRHWCLKESYVKAVGVGIGMNLLSLDFNVNEPISGIVTSTSLGIDGKLEESWRFEEQLLDEEHCVCVALKLGKSAPQPFQLIQLKDLYLPNCRELPNHEKVATDFEMKEEEPQIWR